MLRKNLAGTPAKLSKMNLVSIKRETNHIYLLKKKGTENKDKKQVRLKAIGYVQWYST